MRGSIGDRTMTVQINPCFVVYEWKYNCYMSKCSCTSACMLTLIYIYISLAYEAGVGVGGGGQKYVCPHPPHF